MYIMFMSLLNNMGGYSNVDPPLPIPNREVKHISADGTGFFIPGE